MRERWPATTLDPGTPPPTSHAAERQPFDVLVAHLATEFIHLSPDRIDGAIERCLRSVVEVLGLDRSTLFQRTDGRPDMVMTHSWAAPGFERVPRLFAREAVPWMLGRILSGEPVVFSRIEDLPPEASRDRDSLRQLGQKSNVSVPLATGNGAFGALSFGTLAAERSWPAALVDQLQAVGNMVASALARQRVDRELRVALTEVQELKQRLEHESRYLREQARSIAGQTRIVGQSAAIREVLSLVERVAACDAPVLITGETGVGKELVAEAIHAHSARSDRTMVKVNCAALPAALVEAELFGREKGAYTGALTRQIGRFELANGSTLFLDEISELSLELQAKLLRVLQAGEFERLGSPHTTRVDVRIVAATNRDLERAVADGKFRDDLYFRLAVVPVAVPPLRERPEDIPVLAWAIVNEIARKMGRHVESIAAETIEQLTRYTWPGNVRELRNVVERALILGDEPTLRMSLPERRGTADTSRALEDVERAHIVRVLEQAGWRVRGQHGAASILGLPPTTLETRMAKLGIRRPT